ncbi:hypothetical protein CFOL_v3_06727 [Cephalotus follicularis]|uniref:Uncharacterized protein n=1 Tax=Cephalotus follicularis TaxID=3775 RepID=A0A1Q3B5C2_CEPFO|nr:hypothetical protein CFOL_v3_06727 [Cephalotus follicularis]
MILHFSEQTICFIQLSFFTHSIYHYIIREDGRMQPFGREARKHFSCIFNSPRVAHTINYYIIAYNIWNQSIVFHCLKQLQCLIQIPMITQAIQHSYVSHNA